MNEYDWQKASAAMDAAFREAGRLRRLAEARESRARQKMMATPEWQAAHAARCAQWQVDSTRKRVARLRSDITDRSAGLRRLMDALRNAKLERRRTVSLFFEPISNAWRTRRHLQRELRTVLADLAQLEVAPELHTEAVAVAEERKHTDG